MHLLVRLTYFCDSVKHKLDTIVFAYGIANYLCKCTYTGNLVGWVEQRGAAKNSRKNSKEQQRETARNTEEETSKKH